MLIKISETFFLFCIRQTFVKNTGFSEYRNVPSDSVIAGNFSAVGVSTYFSEKNLHHEIS
jgi:hypothetical protein